MIRLDSLRYSVLSLLFFMQLMANGQGNDKGDFIVLNSGETLYGQVEHIRSGPGISRFSEKIRFTATSGKKKKYKRDKVLAFKAGNFDYEKFVLSQSSDGFALVNPKYDIDPSNGEIHFLRVMKKGRLSHYQLEWIEQGESAVFRMDLLKKADDAYFIRATQGLLGLKRKVLTAYFVECQEVQEKITNREFRQVADIITFYNSECAN